MKKFTYILFACIVFALHTFAQGEVDAIKTANDDLHGTARAMAMGGAFGALGGDLTGVQTNPAGIAVYRSSEVVGTINFTSTGASVDALTKNKNKFDFDNIGFIGYFPTRSNVVPLVNFGFSYNKVKSFDREINAAAGGRSSSLTDYIADISSRGKGVDPTLLEFQDGKQDPFKTGAPWLSVFGFNAYLIRDYQDSNGFYYKPILPEGEKVENRLNISEKGSVNDYDFTVGTTINNVLNMGLSLTVSDIRYDLYSKNTENFAQGDKSGFDLHNWLTTEGAGFGAKLGVIYRPVNAIRLGLAYHTPTWFVMSDRYAAKMTEDLTAYKYLMPQKDQINYEPATTKADEAFNDYNFTTPDKWVVSLATVLGRSMIISADYELTDYTKMKLNARNKSEDEMFYRPNTFIKSDFQAASTMKVGIEYRFTPQFSGRLGYAWKQSPYNDDFKKAGNAETVGSTTIYTLEGNANYFTGGLGYRFNPNTYIDFAVVYKSQKEDLYPYPNVYTDKTREKIAINAAPYSLDMTTFRGLVTLGYKF